MSVTLLSFPSVFLFLYPILHHLFIFVFHISLCPPSVTFFFALFLSHYLLSISPLFLSFFLSILPRFFLNKINKAGVKSYFFPRFLGLFLLCL